MVFAIRFCLCNESFTRFTSLFPILFSDFSTNPWKPILWTAAILFFTHYIIIHGVRNGIERASKIMMPALFVLLVAIVIASCLLPGASKGVEFLLKPDFSKVTGDVFLGALGQSFYSMSIAMGCICTYASYYSRHTNLLNSAVQIGLIDTIVAILAGLMIFPAAFSVGSTLTVVLLLSLSPCQTSSNRPSRVCLSSDMLSRSHSIYSFLWQL